MLTRDKLTKALKQASETARFALAQGCTTDRGIAALDAQRAVQEADEYLAAGDMLEAYGLFCFAISSRAGDEPPPAGRACGRSRRRPACR
jgi:hypothetical protein